MKGSRVQVPFEAYGSYTLKHRRMNGSAVFFGLCNYVEQKFLLLAFRDYLNPKKKSLGARSAYLILNKAIIKYENGEGTRDELLEAFDKGENMMTKTTYED